MQAVFAYSALLLTVGVAVGRPRLGGKWEAGPATAAVAGVGLLLITGVVRPGHIVDSLQLHWRPFLTIIAIMIMAASAQQIGVIEQLAEMIFSDPQTPSSKLFAQVFLLSAVTSSILNNDAMVILLTPLVLTLVKKRYPGHTRLLAPFAFAVFLAIGVAPFFISNPMNMIVAEYANLNFNQYASWMLPVTVAGWAVTYPIVRLYFARELAADVQPVQVVSRKIELDGNQWGMLLLLFLLICLYPLVALIDGPSIWIVAVVGAAASVYLCSRSRRVELRELILRTVAWDIFVFLLGVYIVAIGLKTVGFTDLLARIYTDAGVWVVGSVAALGSAVVNNHPMSLINLMALEGVPDAGRREILAGLIGGDLGPRLLPIGSLAGLLWIDGCRRLGAKIRLGQFVFLGLLVTIPAVAVSLLILELR